MAELLPNGFHEKVMIYSIYYITKSRLDVATVCQRYTNADLKICQYLRLHMKIIYWNFYIQTPFTFWDIHTLDM